MDSAGRLRFSAARDPDAPLITRWQDAGVHGRGRLVGAGHQRRRGQETSGRTGISVGAVVFSRWRADRVHLGSERHAGVAHARSCHPANAPAPRRARIFVALVSLLEQPPKHHRSENGWHCGPLPAPARARGRRRRYGVVRHPQFLDSPAAPLRGRLYSLLHGAARKDRQSVSASSAPRRPA